MKTTHETLKEKLECYSEKVPQTGCWIWLYSLNHKDYGVVVHKRKMQMAHRAAYESFIEAIPDGLLLLHHCDVCCCINPAHLYVGTDADNGRDKTIRGRSAPKGGELNGRSVLTEEQVKEIKKLKGIYKSRKIARLFNVSRSCVKHILANRTWKDV